MSNNRSPPLDASNSNLNGHEKSLQPSFVFNSDVYGQQFGHSTSTHHHQGNVNVGGVAHNSNSEPYSYDFDSRQLSSRPNPSGSSINRSTGDVNSISSLTMSRQARTGESAGTNGGPGQTIFQQSNSELHGNDQLFGGDRDNIAAMKRAQASNKGSATGSPDYWPDDNYHEDSLVAQQARGVGGNSSFRPNHVEAPPSMKNGVGNRDAYLDDGGLSGSLYNLNLADRQGGPPSLGTLGTRGGLLDNHDYTQEELAKAVLERDIANGRYPSRDVGRLLQQQQQLQPPRALNYSAGSLPPPLDYQDYGDVDYQDYQYANGGRASPSAGRGPVPMAGGGMLRPSQGHVRGPPPNVMGQGRPPANIHGGNREFDLLQQTRNVGGMAGRPGGGMMGGPPPYGADLAGGRHGSYGAPQQIPPHHRTAVVGAGPGMVVTAGYRDQQRDAGVVNRPLQPFPGAYGATGSVNSLARQQFLLANRHNSIRRVHAEVPNHTMMGPFYKVQFKCRFRYFVLSPTASRDIKPGEYVKVEADRGEDLGIVHSVMSADAYYREMSYLTAATHPSGKDDDATKEVKMIVRIATTYEKRQLQLKAHDENQVLNSCVELNSIYMLPMGIVDVEFQFDRHKLTIYYDSGSRIDFREFVRDLFAVYKTRIWMQPVDVYFQPDEDLAAALISGNLFGADGGHRIQTGIQSYRIGGGASLPALPAGSAVSMNVHQHHHTVPATEPGSVLSFHDFHDATAAGSLADPLQPDYDLALSSASAVPNGILAFNGASRGGRGYPSSQHSVVGGGGESSQTALFDVMGGPYDSRHDVDENVTGVSTGGHLHQHRPSHRDLLPAVGSGGGYLDDRDDVAPLSWGPSSTVAVGGSQPSLLPSSTASLSPLSALAPSFRQPFSSSSSSGSTSTSTVRQENGFSTPASGLLSGNGNLETDGILPLQASSQQQQHQQQAMGDSIFRVNHGTSHSTASHLDM